MKRLAKVLAAARRSIAYLTESAVLDFTIDLERAMKAINLNRAELARRIGTSPAYVTKVLSGQGNLTVKSMVSLGHAVNARVRIHLEPLESSTFDADWQTAGTALAVYRFPLDVYPVAAANDEWLTLKPAA